MKTSILLSTVLFLLSTSLSSQLKVQDTGKINVGLYNNLNSGILNIGMDGVNNGLSFYDSRYGGSPFSIYRTSNNVYFTRGLGSANGLKMSSDGQILLGLRAHDKSEAWGARLIVASPKAEVTFSVLGHPDMPIYGDIAKVQVYNDNHTAFAIWRYDIDTKTALKTFYINGDGSMWSKAQYITSDASTKKEVRTIDSPLSKIMKIRGVTFKSKLEESKTDIQSTENDSSISTKLISQINSDNKRLHMGVIAQEIEAVIPEVVRTSFDGTKAVAYHELVGLLIEAIKEQQLQINDLENLVSEELRKGNEALSLPSSVIAKDNALYQNIPNPFSNSTEIKYYLSADTKTAALYIYDMQGKQIKSINNLSNGENAVVIDGNELIPGMYIYTLIANGKEIGTKRMILTN